MVYIPPESSHYSNIDYLMLLKTILYFSHYLNDLETELCRKYKGLSNLSDLIENKIVFDDIVVYLKLNSLLYADDTIIMAESKADLQTALNTLGTCIL